MNSISGYKQIKNKSMPAKTPTFKLQGNLQSQDKKTHFQIKRDQPLEGGREERVVFLADRVNNFLTIKSTISQTYPPMHQAMMVMDWCWSDLFYRAVIISF